MAAESGPSLPSPHGGRPRDPRIDTAVLQATLSVLDESGYGRLALEEVARRAGTTKPAIYRRWPNRQRLVLAALATRLGAVSTPDSGCTLCDLSEGINVFIEVFRGIHADVLGPLLADCTSEPGLRDTFMATLFDPPRNAVAQMLDRAAARGDLRADMDRDLVLDMLGSLVHYRALFGHALTSETEVEGAVVALLRGIATDYPALMERSRQLAGDPQFHATHG
ncbi:TetR/AcrR family transcriptional regulator [Actinomadura sp. 7K507]|uniref:TetR/AcrR family transcriptional regulator n=1 Tax=Actinomadura sp. 7K507 TaxID=2530365 RepID=UPI001042BA93|nr:TetR/AcrR family transcriptional regulator [Actinomadura sp. 7K507]TDC75157.1 TetR/AcrR family transcriptional regulator [Actinomadura sp. 7K507]